MYGRDVTQSDVRSVNGPRLRQEIYISVESKTFFIYDVTQHKLQIDYRARDIDIPIPSGEKL